MTDHTTAAQAAEQAIKAAIRKAYDDGYNDAKMAPDNCSTYCVERAVRLDSAALLSALRDPVADKPAFYINPEVIDHETGDLAAHVDRAITWSREETRAWSLPVYLTPRSASAPVADERITWIADYEPLYYFAQQHKVDYNALCKAARAALASAPADERAALHHVANEWADMATCAIQWIRNIKNGVSTPEAALENLMSNLTHCQEVQSCAGVRPSRENAPVAGEAVACLRRQREGSDWGHWTPATVEDGQRVTGLRSWQVRWLVDATPEAIADGLTVEIRLPNGTNISGWMKMASQAHLSAAPVECPPVAGERAFQLVQDLRAFAAMQRWFGEHGYDSVGASGRLAVSNALFARLCAALSAQPAEKPATSAPSPAASQRQAMVPGSQESGNSHTDGGAVYE